MSEPISWLILVYRIPSEPTRLRAAVWRRLRETFVVSKGWHRSLRSSGRSLRMARFLSRWSIRGLVPVSRGTRTLDSWSAKWTPLLIAPLRDLVELIAVLTEKVSSATPQGSPDQAEQQSRYRQLIEGTMHLPPEAQDAWHRFIEIFKPDPLAM